jgi:hypothetical protein
VTGSLEEGRGWFAEYLAAAHPDVTVSPAAAAANRRPGFHRIERRR